MRGGWGMGECGLTRATRGVIYVSSNISHESGQSFVRRPIIIAQLKCRPRTVKIANNSPRPIDSPQNHAEPLDPAPQILFPISRSPASRTTNTCPLTTNPPTKCPPARSLTRSLAKTRTEKSRAESSPSERRERPRRSSRDRDKVYHKTSCALLLRSCFPRRIGEEGYGSID